MLLAVARMSEVLFESFPQAVLQSYILMRTDEPTTLQPVKIYILQDPFLDWAPRFLHPWPGFSFPRYYFGNS